MNASTSQAGLAPRYVVGALPEDGTPHVGTTDVDLVIGIAIAADSFEAYRTLHTNLTRSGFHQITPSFAWTRDVDGASVTVEFMCETDTVEPGAIFKPGEGTGSNMAAFNVRGALLAADDFVPIELEGDRLDGGGISRVTLRVAGLLAYTVLKTFAFQDRHENKDAYDLVFTLLNAEGGPENAGVRARTNPIADHDQVGQALDLLADRFSTAKMDGPSAYAAFLTAGDEDEDARSRQRAAATVRAFLNAFWAQS